MKEYPFEKKPAFFPFVNAEVFFEAEATEIDTANAAAADADMDSELDEILGLA